MELIFFIVITLGSAWGVTKLLLAANASVGLTEYCPWICDVIHAMGCDVRTVVFWLLVVIFALTGLPLRLSRSIVPLVGWVLIAIAVIAVIGILWSVVALLINSL